MQTFVNNRVLWTEGMLLTPQHFQQHDRYVEYLIQNKNSCRHADCWGLKYLKISQESLKIGKLRLLLCVALFPEGAFYNAPDVDLLPEPINITQKMNHRTIYLVLSRGKNFSYRVFNQNIIDITNEQQAPVTVTMCHLVAKLFVEVEEQQRNNALPIAKIEAVAGNGAVTLSPVFIPACLNYQVSSRLEMSLEKAQFLIKQLVAQYVREIKYNVQITHDDIKIYRLVQILNQFYRRVTFIRTEAVHPYKLYRELSFFLSNFAACAMDEDTLFKKYSYQHNQLSQTFDDLLQDLFKVLNKLIKIKAFKTELVLRDDNLWVSKKEILPLDSLRILILSIYIEKNINVTMEDLSCHIKVAPVDTINHLICHALPGFVMKRLKQNPITVTDIKNTLYYLLEYSKGNHATSQKIACHIDIPVTDIKLSLEYLKNAER